MEFKFNVGDKVRMIDDLDGICYNATGCMAKYGEILKVDYDIESNGGMPYYVLFMFNDYAYPLWCKERQLELIED